MTAPVPDSAAESSKPAASQTPEPPAKPAWWHRVLKSPIFKLAIAASILGYLYNSGRLDFKSFQGPHMNWWLIAAALAATLPSYFIASFRFKFILQSLGLRCKFRQAFVWTLVGCFWDVSMPSATGGDLVKIVYVVHTYGKGNRAVAAASVLIDRLVGLIGLFTFALIAMLVKWDSISGDKKFAQVPYILIAIVSAAALGLVILSLKSLKEAKWRYTLVHKIPHGNKLEKIYLVFHNMARRPLLLLGILGLSLLNHTVWVTAAILLSYGLGLEHDISKLAVVIPLASFFNIFGVAGGIGAGTAAFDYLFESLLGAAKGEGARVGLANPMVGNLSKLVCGGIVYLTSEKLLPSEVEEVDDVGREDEETPPSPPNPAPTAT